MTFILTTNHLTQILKGNKEIEAWHKAMVNVLPNYKIDTVERVAAFLAQCAHESNSFTVLEENLNYSAEQLQKTWPKRFDAKLAAQVARQPQRIAEIAYGGRMGNTQPNDGWLFRGQGVIQLTGRDNLTNWGMTLNKSAEQAVGYIRTKGGAIEAACWYWKVKNLNKWVDAGDFDGLSDAINIGRKTAKIGDAHGFPDRKKRYDNALAVLAGKAAYVAPVAPVVATPSVTPEVSTRVRSTTHRTLPKAPDSTE